mgnify:CR=1 FL=1
MVDGVAGEVGLHVQSRVEVEQNLDPGLAQVQVLFMAVNLVLVLREINRRVTLMDVQVF